MDSLKNHVDNMFSNYKENEQIRELKYEVLSNLEAKVDDLTANGMKRREAINRAKESISSIDYLIEGNRQVYVNKYKLEYIQIVLLYFIIAWILTIPVKIIGIGIILNMILFICSITIGIGYLVLNRKTDSEYFQFMSTIDIQLAYKVRKIAWIIWILFIAVSTFYTSAIQFGSNIWFSRPVSITVPYQFAVLAIKYVLPLISIIIPMVINVAPKLILRYEVGEDDENKE